MNGSKVLEHQGIKVELIGQIGVPLALAPCCFLCPRGAYRLAVVGAESAEGKLSLPAELLHDRSNTYEFTSLVRELDVPGGLQGTKTFPFEFTNVEKQYESYDGINVRLR